MSNLAKLIDNNVLWVAVVAWAAAQITKALLNFAVTRRFDLERLFGTGGMPSSHTSTVCALTLAVARTTGLNSPEFAISFVLAAVVMTDAMGVRRQAGEQAKVLNRLLFSDELEKDEEGKELPFDFDRELSESERQNIEEYLGEHNRILDRELKEYLGHTPMEVLAGALLGILVAMFLPVA